MRQQFRAARRIEYFQKRVVPLGGAVVRAPGFLWGHTRGETDVAPPQGSQGDPRAGFVQREVGGEERVGLMGPDDEVAAFAVDLAVPVAPLESVVLVRVPVEELATWATLPASHAVGITCMSQAYCFCRWSCWASRSFSLAARVSRAAFTAVAPARLPQPALLFFIALGNGRGPRRGSRLRRPLQR